ncbi:HD domain-containing protein [Helicobacter kayseriensis]|uniref:HD domain-containing protein n=1 Tax=Helicobacter kayseriensis TaxID=2905877 RepID=UPI001E3AADEC|nr:HD domain-containing protein [Helicobacter kayseriensis]MCE3046775.1 HD domain-containing protein [Helicobacter kayseriensis]MCE3047923.1 HD domain-containing protein [Helicobacter kayseriensis]
MQTPRITSDFLRKIFISASIRRWNDQACPVEFVELDKQAHKMLIAYFLASYEEHTRNIQIDWEKLILYFCFEFFERMVLTDIKPPVFHKLQKHHRNELADFVVQELHLELAPFGMLEDLESYLKSPPKCIETEILRASHFYASKWEFDIIYHFNPYMYDVENIKKIIDQEVEQFYHLTGIAHITLYKKSQELIAMFGQLRFQKRWSQTPRVPETSVLGHTLVVAILGYFLSLDLNVCKQMRINHFLCGLFHDLPEILTRDIISPIKRSVKGLDGQIKRIEEEAVKEKILSFVPSNIAEDILYFTQQEFSNRYKVEHLVYQAESAEDLIKFHNRDEDNPVCGEFMKFCDRLSAFLEARISIGHGISSKDLVEGSQGIYDACKHQELNGLDLGALVRNFI